MANAEINITCLRYRYTFHQLYKSNSLPFFVEYHGSWYWSYMFISNDLPEAQFDQERAGFFSQDVLIDDIHENDFLSFIFQDMTYFDKYDRKADLGHSLILVVEK